MTRLNVTVDQIVNLAIQAIPADEVSTVSDVIRLVEDLLVGPYAPFKPRLEEIANEIFRRVTVKVGRASVLENNVDHEPWLHGIDRSRWALWQRLESYLLQVDKLPVSVLAELDRSTDRVLERLEAPTRKTQFDRRGLVVGHVQSGKTTHYTALAAKAIDSGYRVVIILAGIHNSLRSQTHERIDRCLTGRDSLVIPGDASGAGINYGVGKHALEMGLSDPEFFILTCTTAAERGDFRRATAQQVWLQVSDGARLVMVVKKNAKILRELKSWLHTLLADGRTARDGRFIEHPTLFIDDEADQASINTNDPDEDPTAINRLIRELVVSFSRVGVVGYTATPFANVFIDPRLDSDQQQCGPDLFPRSFIVGLKAPSNYIGPAVVFGHPGDESAGIPAQDPLPMYVEVTDSAAWIEPKHKKDLRPGELPASLCVAIRLFMINCAIRAIRGDVRAHNSMLVHATRFVTVQQRIREQIDDEVAKLQSVLSHGAAGARTELEREFREVWDRHLVKDHARFVDRLGDAAGNLPDWTAVWSDLDGVARRIEVRDVNGSSDDALVYSRRPEGLWVIAIGGDKLSRGLTLEGLSVSYFLRTSSMFDTLMQMGRWFGYRPRYGDLCRVFTSRDLYGAFREIALAIDDLRSDLDRMALGNHTPADFGLRVRTPSDRLLITAANKIRRGEEIQVRFAGEVVQTLSIPRTGRAAVGNREALESFVKALDPLAAVGSVRSDPTGNFVWSNVSASHVIEFLRCYTAFRTVGFLGGCEQLCRYVSDRNRQGELVRWTVCLMSSSRGRQVNIAGLRVGLLTRKPEDGAESTKYAMRGLTMAVDESIDLSVEEYGEALQRSRDDWQQNPTEDGREPERPSRESSRTTRPTSHGLLLLYPIEMPKTDASEFGVGVAISFPASPTAPPLLYTVNDVWKSEYGLNEVSDDQ
jgi:hypothetical protein